MSIEKVRKFVSRNEDLYPEYGLLKDAILELDARVKELKDSLAEHRDWHRAGGLIPKPTPVLNDAKVPVCDQVKEFYERKKMLNEAKPNPTDEIIPMNFHDHLNTYHTKEAKPRSTDEDLVEKYIAVLKATTPGTPWDFHLISNILRQLISEART